MPSSARRGEGGGGAYWNAVGVFLADALGLGLALLECVLVLELAGEGISIAVFRLSARRQGRAAATRGTHLRILTVLD